MVARETTPTVGGELADGKRIGAYVVERVRARLPHVVVHQARHVVTGRPVAIQLLRPRTDAPSVHAIRRDLAALNRLRHAHVAEILETGELDDGRPYLVVEWIDGRSLQTRLDERGPLTLDEALPIADQIAAALTAAHALGVVHGELHARNVGLVERGDHLAVKLVNFGMARLSGTRLAPEQAHGGAGAFDRRVDVFALGALVYQMVTGAQPHADPPPPSASCTVPLAFDEVVLRALRADPARRWVSIEALMTALHEALAGAELVAELHVTAYLDPSIDDVDARALEDAEHALVVAQRWLERQNVALVLGGAGAVVATARIPRALEQQRAARAGWVRLAGDVQQHMDARRRPHPAVRTRVQIRIEG
jgi:serine/threonine-protein kinase